MHAYACEALEPYLQPGARVLDVGSGSGYLVGVLAHLVGPTGHVTGIEHLPGLVSKSRENLAKDETLRKWVEDKRIQIVQGDGRNGWLQGAPYDAIHVGAGAPHMPAMLIDQLAQPGR
jgi:protein-L-isoaspartate(D-aspartate) O-methyltransferase